MRFMAVARKRRAKSSGHSSQFPRVCNAINICEVIRINYAPARAQLAGMANGRLLQLASHTSVNRVSA